MNQIQLLGILEIGLIYVFTVIAVYITFIIIEFPDLTIDGSFTLGAAVTVKMIILGFNPWFAVIIAMLSGGIAGFITAYLNIKWKILNILAGIITMTGLYSVNLRIMEAPNVTIVNNPTIFGNDSVIIGVFVIVLVISGILIKLFNSEFGLAIKAVGNNPKICASYGININLIRFSMLMLTNSLVALSGSIFAQSQGYADISIGTGTAVASLAALIIGSVIVRPTLVSIYLISCIFGSIMYRTIIAFSLQANDIGLNVGDLNLIIAFIIAIAIRLKMKIL